MAFQSYTGAAYTDVAGGGLRSFIDYVIAANANNDLYDLQSNPMYGLISGVLVGGDITASALAVTIPSGLAFYARQVWINSGTYTLNVADASTTAVWGCCDGQIRTSAGASTYPSTFDYRTACLLCVVTSSGGVATVDNTQRQWARSIDGTGRRVLDNGGVWAPVPDTIPSTSQAIVPAQHQIQIFDSLTVNGAVTVHGKLRVA